MSLPKTALSTQHSALSTAFSFAALAAVVGALLLDIVAAVRLNEPDFLPTQPWLSSGRDWNAYGHGILFGWLANAFFAFLYFAVPRPAGRTTSRALGWLLFLLWNVGVVIPGWLVLQTGVPAGWANLPLGIDAALAVALLLAFLQFAAPLFRGPPQQLTISGLYVIAALGLTLSIVVIDRLVPAVRGGHESLGRNDACKVFVPLMAMAVAYFVVPAMTRRPIFDRALPILALLLMFLAYPLSRSPEPSVSVIASVCIAASAVLNAANLLVSLRGAVGTVVRDAPLRFVWFSLVASLIAGTVMLVEALTPLGRLVQFSDWVTARSALWLIGIASFAALGGLLHARQRLPGRGYNPRLAALAFWLLAVAVSVKVVDLAAAGVVQGKLWQSDAAWLEAVRASRPYWWTKAAADGVVLLGFVVAALGMATGRRAEVGSVLADFSGADFVGDRPATAARPVSGRLAAVGVLVGAVAIVL